jgi:holliday junction DNA helicase RuvA
MIAHLTGKIISSKPTQIVIDVNGVGYVVFISINTFEKISDKEIVSLFIYTNVRDDAINLFGFYSEGEKEMFELLISVNGIGPKLALGLLSGISVEELKTAIVSGNVARIVAVPGIGRKTAERVVLELRSKVGDIKEEGIATEPGIKKEAIAALNTLGYNPKTSEKIIHEIVSTDKNISLEELIKQALQKLNK